MIDRRPSKSRIGMTNDQLQRKAVERAEAIKPEHDSGAARVIRAWLEESISCD